MAPLPVRELDDQPVLVGQCVEVHGRDILAVEGRADDRGYRGYRGLACGCAVAFLLGRRPDGAYVAKSRVIVAANRQRVWLQIPSSLTRARHHGDNVAAP
jgi:hypothetical protein